MQRTDYYLTEEQFGRFRPLHGIVVLEPLQDVGHVEIAGHKFYWDTSFTPEENQVVVNRVVKVSHKKDIVHDKFFRSHLDINIGDIVWVNYYTVLHSSSIVVGSKVYRLLEPRNLYMALSEAGYRMLNDWVMIDPAVFVDDNPLVPEGLRSQPSGIYCWIARTPEYRTFKYTPHNSVLEVKAGDFCVLRDPASFKLEHAPHFFYDKKPHYVVRAEKIVATATPGPKFLPYGN